jgi:hypothetical protein
MIVNSSLQHILYSVRGVCFVQTGAFAPVGFNVPCYYPSEEWEGAAPINTGCIRVDAGLHSIKAGSDNTRLQTSVISTAWVDENFKRYHKISHTVLPPR